MSIAHVTIATRVGSMSLEPGARVDGLDVSLRENWLATVDFYTHKSLHKNTVIYSNIISTLYSVTHL
jgi:hypothetical protein